MDTKVQEKLDNFFVDYKIKKYKKREILISPDQEPKGLFYLKEGSVRQYTVSQTGEELTINIFKPISFFPMGWVLNNTTPSHYFEAMIPVTVQVAPKEEFLKFIQKEQSILLDLLKRIYKGLEGFFMRMEYLMGGKASSRLITELLIYAKRFGQKEKDGILIKLKLTEKDLAAQTGIARETVSRQLHILIEKKLITYDRGSLVINNLQQLESELLI